MTSRFRGCRPEARRTWRPFPPGEGWPLQIWRRRRRCADGVRPVEDVGGGRCCCRTLPTPRTSTGAEGACLSVSSSTGTVGCVPGANSPARQQAAVWPWRRGPPRWYPPRNRGAGALAFGRVGATTVTSGVLDELLDDVDQASRVRPDVELASGRPLRRHGENAKGARKRRGAKA